MKAGKQTTLRDVAAVTGIGVHSGLPVTLTLHPADADTGIVFLRTGIAGCRDREIRADVQAYELMRGVGNLCIGAEHDPGYDARRLVGLLVAGLRRS